MSVKKLPKKNSYELEAWTLGRFVCGIDEVGRGSLAGPVVTAAVILPIDCTYDLLKDSKLMSAQERNQAAHWIKKNCLYSYGIVHHRLIDTHNIWHATLIAMRKALMHLLVMAPHKPSAILVDAMPLNLNNCCYADIPVHHFPFGEKKSSSIAAASILAKVKRDSMMLHMDKVFPHYSWHNNKGYATQPHKQALQEHSSVIIHRRTYLKDILNSQASYIEDYAADQQYII